MNCEGMGMGCKGEAIYSKCGNMFKGMGTDCEGMEPVVKAMPHVQRCGNALNIRHGNGHYQTFECMAMPSQPILMPYM